MEVGGRERLEHVLEKSVATVPSQWLKAARY